jgi:hypothetical protein
MRLTLIRCTVAAAAGLFASAASPATATAADCDLAIRHASVVAELGERAFTSQSYVVAGDMAASARIPSIDATRHAKACGCPEALPHLEDATLTAARANVVLNATGAQQYGARLKKDADAALEALRRCAAR